jgi:hypothetical protein
MFERPANTALQLFFEALIDPSLHKKVSPSHPAIPPLRPEHGVLAAWAEDMARHSASNGRLSQRIGARFIGHGSL